MKHNSYDVVLAARLIDNMRHPEKFLAVVDKMMSPKGLLVIASANHWNDKITKKEEWIGGQKVGGENLSTHKKLQELLLDRFNEVEAPFDSPYCLKLDSRTIKYQVAQITVWQLK